MRALVPFTGVGPLKNEMERLFDRFFEPDNGDSFAMGEWAPRHTGRRPGLRAGPASGARPAYRQPGSVGNT
jgi:hypothetical protein